MGVDHYRYTQDLCYETGAGLPFHDHQNEATNAALHCFLEKGVRRGKNIMWCATGKTFVLIKVMEEVVADRVRSGRKGPKPIALLVAPTLNLAGQLMEAFEEHRAPGLVPGYVPVCSRDEIADGLGESFRSTATTDPDRLAAILSEPDPSSDYQLVVSTFHSVKVVSEALKVMGRAGKVLITCVDEAHHAAGEGSARDFSMVLRQSRIPSRYRYFSTATEVVLPRRTRKTKKGQRAGKRISMDDEALFGPTLYRLTADQAIDRGITEDYSVHPLPVCLSDLRSAMADPDSPYAGYEDPEDAVSAYATAHVARTYSDLCHAISYHDRIEKADRLAAAVMAESESGDLRSVEAVPFHSGIDVGLRQRMLKGFGDPTADGAFRLMVTCDAGNEGLDIKAVDCLIFAQPKRSAAINAQRLGRALRRVAAGADHPSRVFVPIVIDDSTYHSPVVTAESRDRFMRSIESLKMIDAKVDLRLEPPISHAPAWRGREWADARAVAIHDAVDYLREGVVNDLMEEAKVETRGVSGTKYYGVHFRPGPGLWNGSVPAVGGRDLVPADQQMHLDAVSAAEAVHAALPSDWTGPRPFGINPWVLRSVGRGRRRSNPYPGVAWSRVDERFVSQIEVPLGNGRSKRATRTYKVHVPVGATAEEKEQRMAQVQIEAARGRDALVHRYDTDTRLFFPEEAPRYELILVDKETLEPGIEWDQTVEGYWAYRRESDGTITDCGTHATMDAARRAREAVTTPTVVPDLADLPGVSYSATTGRYIAQVDLVRADGTRSRATRTFRVDLDADEVELEGLMVAGREKAARARDALVLRYGLDKPLFFPKDPPRVDLIVKAGGFEDGLEWDPKVELWWAYGRATDGSCIDLGYHASVREARAARDGQEPVAVVAAGPTRERTPAMA